jgi:hypothetical protein
MWLKTAVVGVVPVLFALGSRPAVSPSAVPMPLSPVASQTLVESADRSINLPSDCASTNAAQQPKAEALLPRARKSAPLPSSSSSSRNAAGVFSFPVPARARAEQLASDRKLRIAHIFFILNRISDVSVQMTPERAVWLDQIVEDLAQQTMDIVDGSVDGSSDRSVDAQEAANAQSRARALTGQAQARRGSESGLRVSTTDPAEISLSEIERTLAKLTAVIEHMIEPEMSL